MWRQYQGTEFKKIETLQEKAIKIFDICKVKNINLEITWISRENNKDADFISKSIDHDDCIVKNSTFNFLTKNLIIFYKRGI